MEKSFSFRFFAESHNLPWKFGKKLEKSSKTLSGFEPVLTKKREFKCRALDNLATKTIEFLSEVFLKYIYRIVIYRITLVWALLKYWGSLWTSAFVQGT